MTYWSESPQEEAEWVYVNLGSLRNKSVEALETAGFFAGNEEAKIDTQVAKTGHGRELKGTAWFEEMIEGSELGRMKRRREGQTSLDGRTKVEWEVVEFDGNDGEEIASGEKRKLDRVGEGDDIAMSSGR